MTPAIFPRAFVLTVLLASTPLFAGFRDDIGFIELQAESGSLPNGSSLKIAHIEYVRDGKWAPEPVGELEGKSITYSPAAPTGFSYHGDEVGRVLYGSLSSVIPAVSQIRAFEAWNYYDFSLNTANGIAPAVADWDIENHSYISNAGLSNNEGGRRMDFRIDRDGVTATVVLENGTGTVPPLFGNTYNTIVVGSSTGSHSRGGTTRDVVGRQKPDIVGTANWTSYAGPIVGSAAGLLIAKAKADSTLALAKRPEVIKALLMAGATKEEFPSWSRSSTAPLDPIYGAGEVNVKNSYGILVAGRQSASPSAIRSSRGWDLNSVGTGSSLLYFFTIGSGQTGTVSAVLTWHRNVSPNNGAWSQGLGSSLDNLDLRLYRANPQFQTGDLIQDSVSTIDNVEHVFMRDLAEGTYALVVSSVSGSKQFGLAWNVSGVTSQPPAVAAPAITTQPAAKTVTEGSSASFSVAASGTSPFTYQWRRNGAAISGANGSSFSIAAAALADAGTYTVVISNSAGSATSNGAYLTVNTAASAPSITTQPTAKTVTEGAAVSFTVAASGTSPFTYQWRKNSVAISGATGSSFSIASAAVADAGTYSVVISNSAGSATSNGAYLTVNAAATASAPSITTQPVPKTVTEGSPVSFSVVVDGTSPFTYQWRKKGTAIPGATGSTFSIASVALSDAGNYTVVISNSAGTATSNGAFLTVNAAATTSAPSITTQPASKTVTEGSPVSFSVSVGGTAPFTYMWRKDGVAISGADSASFSLNSVGLSDAGTYSVVVSNSDGSVTSTGAYLQVSQVMQAPTVTVQPVPAIVQVGSPASFSVSATGSGPLTYQWRKNGVTISGAVAPTLMISSAQTSDAASYSVLVANSAGSVASSGATLTVQSSPSGSTGGRLGNISSRAKVQTGSGILISGFVVAGSQPKTLLVRAVGPTLSNFDLNGLLRRPMIRIFSGSTLIEEIPAGGRVPSAEVTRDAATRAGAFSLPENSSDCVIVRSFAPGGYTVHVFGEYGGTGIALVEVYDLDASSSGSRVVNLSTRSNVGRNDEILIPGLSVTGASPKQVLIRAVGPGLLNYDVEGVLERPRIALYKGNTVVTENTGWTSSPNAGEIAAVASRVGAFALSESSADSALLVTLAPGGYTLHITGADGGTGVVLAEVFEVPSN